MEFYCGFGGGTNKVREGEIIMVDIMHGKHSTVGILG